MEEDNKREGENGSSNIAAILRERDRLEKELQKKFKKTLSILFTDICGYTKFMDTRGDISGRAMLQKHNDIVMPMVKKHGGTVIKTIGDAVMATFAKPLEATKAAIDIQKGLFEYNMDAENADKIHVKIGVNTGDALMDDADVFGDAVNVASRIQSQAGKDQILISETVYEQVRGSEDILCRSHGTVQVKGKAEALELYRVVWQDEDVILDTEPRVRAQEMAARKISEAPIKVLQIEITKEGDHLKISAYEQNAGEVNTVRHYEDLPVPMDNIGARCSEIVKTLNNANREGRITREILVKLREIGQIFRDELFTPNVKEKVSSSKADYLVMNLDDQLVHVPWELLHDGKQFLSQRFNMGRLVKTKQTIMSSKSRLLARPLKMLILADPKGDLKGAYQEGTQIRDFIDHHRDLIGVSLRSDDITPDFIREKIRNFDLVHFAGHSDYNSQDPGESGWQLTKGVIRAQEIVKMAGTAAMPALIFSNTCQSARTEEWGLEEDFHDKIFGLANAFILAGVKHYIGTFWEILDEPSRRFAMEFYKQFLAGMRIGEAMRSARLALIHEYGEETIVWASYLLYGDPTTNYMEKVKEIEVTEEPAPVSVLPKDTYVRAKEEVLDFAERDVKKKKTGWLVGIAFVIALAAFLLWGYPGFLREDTQKYETAIMTYYNEGHFDEALQASESLEKKSPKVRLAYLTEGNIYLRKGNLDKAEAAYQKALQATKGTDAQKAEAFIGLGRIASFRKQSENALKYYQQATESAPDNRMGYLSQGLLLENRGDFDQALTLLGKAQAIAPNDRVVAAITNETRKKVAMANDQEKQERINKLVDELLKSIDSPPRALPSDGWTSQPLTLWLMDFTIRGYSLQEGEDRLLASGITDQIIEKSRAQVVERALLDKLLEELKLSTTKLIDRRTAISLGKIMAARLILSGQILYSGPQTQVSLRVIETETGRISAVVNETFGSSVPLSLLSEKLSENLLKKLNTLYPLRGKIQQVIGDEIILNIGEKEGVRTGQRFKAANEDLMIEIISTQSEKSTAKKIKGEETPKTGQRVSEA